jgi:predicted HD superfamily hydrolase involved in NAD metabolism
VIKEGIPTTVSLDRVKEWIKPKVSEKRFKHIAGVAAVAKKLAARAGCDADLAELAGWLHDACKEVKDTELVEQAKMYYLSLDPILEQNGHLLHGPVSAEVAKRELGIANREVLDAVAQHTLGAVGMTDLSKVIFLADCLEPNRPGDYTKPIWEALDQDGKTNLDWAIVVAIDEGLKFLIEDKKAIHPKTITVRNHYLALVKEQRARSGGH